MVIQAVDNNNHYHSYYEFLYYHNGYRLLTVKGAKYALDKAIRGFNANEIINITLLFIFYYKMVHAKLSATPTTCMATQAGFKSA